MISNLSNIYVSLGMIFTIQKGWELFLVVIGPEFMFTINLNPVLLSLDEKLNRFFYGNFLL
jgi:hypothetical protein